MVDEFVTLMDRLKFGLPASPAARDALNLVELVLNAPTPPAKFGALSLLLKSLCREPNEREATAQEWRDAASEVAELYEYTFAGQMLELGLYEHALPADPKPALQMFFVSQHLRTHRKQNTPLQWVRVPRSCLRAARNRCAGMQPCSPPL